MTLKLALETMFGAFLLPFFARTFWGKMATRWGAIGGYTAAVVIVGTIWAINHGKGNPMIHQTGTVWIDMAWTAAIGLFAASVISGGKIRKSIPTIFAAVVSGILGGYILTLI